MCWFQHLTGKVLVVLPAVNDSGENIDIWNYRKLISRANISIQWQREILQSLNEKKKTNCIYGPHRGILLRKKNAYEFIVILLARAQ